MMFSLRPVLSPGLHYELAHSLSSHQFTCSVAHHFLHWCCRGLSSQLFKWMHPNFLRVKEIWLHLPTASLDFAKWIPGIMPRPSKTKPLPPLNVNMYAIIQIIDWASTCDRTWVPYPSSASQTWACIGINWRNIKIQLPGPPRRANSVGQGWGPNSAFLTSFQMMLIFPVHGSHLEEHCFRGLNGE